MYYSKLIGIREKHWDIDGVKGTNKTLYFTQAEDETENSFLNGVAPHCFVINPDDKIFNYDLIVNNEYLLILGEGKANSKGVVKTPIIEILTKDYKPVARVDYINKK